MNKMEKQVEEMRHKAASSHPYIDGAKWNLLHTVMAQSGITVSLVYHILRQIGFFSLGDFDILASQEQFDELFRRLKIYAKLNAFI